MQKVTNMGLVDLGSKFVDFEKTIAEFRVNDGSFVGPLVPDAYGFPRTDSLADMAENAYLVRSIKESKGRYRLLSLGAAPGEWAIRAERVYRKVHGDGDYLSINVESDLGHVQIIDQFFKNNNVSLRKNIILYAAIANINGWAYMPVTDPATNWGCGVVAVSGEPAKLDANIVMSDSAKMSTAAGIAGQPIQFCGVMAVELEWLFTLTGKIDFLHADIQGGEGVIFHSKLDALKRYVRRLCISVHGQKIEASLLTLFGNAGWRLEEQISGVYVQSGEFEDSHQDGLLIWFNPEFVP
jgi:hypothetical protein